MTIGDQIAERLADARRSSPASDPSCTLEYVERVHLDRNAAKRDAREHCRAGNANEPQSPVL